MRRALQELSRELREPTFDEVQPRRARRREMEVEPRVAQQPCLYSWGLVRGGVVQDDVHFEVIRHGFVDLHEESLEFLGPVTPASGRDHLAGRDIERREEICDPVAHIVMRPSLHLAGSHRQDRLSPVECLDAGLLVDTVAMMTVSRLRIDVETRRFPSVRGPACAQAHFRCFAFRNSHKYLNLSV